MHTYTYTNNLNAFYFLSFADMVVLKLRRDETSLLMVAFGDGRWRWLLVTVRWCSVCARGDFSIFYFAFRLKWCRFLIWCKVVCANHASGSARPDVRSQKQLHRMSFANWQKDFRLHDRPSGPLQGTYQPHFTLLTFISLVLWRVSCLLIAFVWWYVKVIGI